MAGSTGNAILDGLPSQLRNSLLTHLRPVELPVGTMISKAGESPANAHFMTSGITSVVTYMSDGVGAEVGLIGSEGLVEAFHLLGPANSPSTSFVQVKGNALRMPFETLREKIFQSEKLLMSILGFVQRYGFIQTQLTACNELHEIEERLARWLLMVRDRIGAERFDLTHEFLSQMLGAQRTSVTMAAGSLQRSGLIEYRRGHIQIIDAESLQSAACECYPVVRLLTAK